MAEERDTTVAPPVLIGPLPAIEEAVPSGITSADTILLPPFPASTPTPRPPHPAHLVRRVRPVRPVHRRLRRSGNARTWRRVTA
ncbi:MAG: hypothetical protein ACRDNL_15565, partial [Spirillospora sp.]